MAISASEIREKLKKVFHPEINNNLVELGMIRDVAVEGSTVLIKLALPFPDVPIKEDLINLIKESIQGDLRVDVVMMNDKERETFLQKAREGWKF